MEEKSSSSSTLLEDDDSDLIDASFVNLEAECYKQSVGNVPLWFLPRTTLSALSPKSSLNVGINLL
jgi:hypothetical protein